MFLHATETQKSFFLYCPASLHEFSKETFLSQDFKPIVCVTLKLVIYC